MIADDGMVDFVDFVDFDLINRIVGVSPCIPQARIRTGRAQTMSNWLYPL